MFMDVDSLRPGEDWVEAVEAAVTRCDVLLAIIGPTWVGAKDEQGESRLSKEFDRVRLEIEAALRNDKPVIPVLVEGASMPTSARAARIAEAAAAASRHPHLALDVRERPEFAGQGAAHDRQAAPPKARVDGRQRPNRHGSGGQRGGRLGTAHADGGRNSAAASRVPPPPPTQAFAAQPPIPPADSGFSAPPVQPVYPSYPAPAYSL